VSTVTVDHFNASLLNKSDLIPKPFLNGRVNVVIHSYIISVNL